jgi:limonene-1,2-epoxide hydrolase
MTMTFLSPTQTVRLFLKAMETLNYREAVKYVAEDCEYANPPSLESVYNGTTGEGELRCASVVFAQRLDRHRLADKWVELPVTGVFEVHDGLITFWRDYFDTATITSHWPMSNVQGSLNDA